MGRSKRQRSSSPVSGQRRNSKYKENYQRTHGEEAWKARDAKHHRDRTSRVNATLDAAASDPSVAVSQVFANAAMKMDANAQKASQKIAKESGKTSRKIAKQSGKQSQQAVKQFQKGASDRSKSIMRAGKQNLYQLYARV